MREDKQKCLEDFLRNCVPQKVPKYSIQFKPNVPLKYNAEPCYLCCTIISIMPFLT